MLVRTIIPTQYNIPKTTDTCVVIAYFNPLNTREKKINANHIIRILLESKIPIYVTELLTENKKSDLFYTTKIVYNKSIFFAKENLWNITETLINDQYKKIIFLDADVKFTNPNWLDESSLLLDHYDVIQPMSDVFKDLPKQHKNYIDIEFKNDFYLTQKSVARSICSTQSANRTQHHPGYAIGIKRDLFHQIWGFYEFALLGGGDCIFWSNIVEYDISDIVKNNTIPIDNIFRAYTANAKQYLKPNKIGYIKNCLALHLRHGSLGNRNYSDRYKKLDNHKQINFWRNEDNVIELDSRTQKLIKDYFISRQE